MLEATLTVAPTPEGFDLTLAVENVGSDRVTLAFRDGQRAEFVADRTGSENGGTGAGTEGNGRGAGDEEAVWHWSEGRMFTMALGAEELGPGESVTETATWSDPAPGEYAVRAWLTTEDDGVRRESEAETVVVVG
ncbi:hypothetical protein HUG10_06475 [Halorarum halophilum]|uniref:Intracellular proteinase inhibitor BsuPI domain-containing protein n=1 Tax=Halorarum halophilum TaxID=2743090 RepID=A0A7D5GKD6_9EURY|nr:BsuPI-related putative proteinase inhibitor [Halobaculum halophilum]QLG27207.1 hypothetical protein HUG10_06475 [Halobaculum halophilum]